MTDAQLVTQVDDAEQAQQPWRTILLKLTGRSGHPAAGQYIAILTIQAFGQLVPFHNGMVLTIALFGLKALSGDKQTLVTKKEPGAKPVKVAGKATQ